MKGLKNREGGQTFYVTPIRGKMTLSSKTEKEGYVKKEFVKDGKTIVKYLMEFDQLTVYLVDAKAEDTDYGRRWSVKGEIDGENYYLQFAYSSGYSKSFFNQLENIDLSKPCTITASYKEEEFNGKTIGVTALWVRQDGEWVGFKYSNDNPGDRPPLEEITVKGVKQHDDTKMQKYYEEVATRIFNELKLSKAQATADNFMTSEITGDEVTIPEGANVSSAEFLTDDDLPF